MKSQSLFRSESLARFRVQPWQPALLSKPVSWPLLFALALFSVMLLVGFASRFEFARKELARGYLVPSGGWTKVTSPRFAVVRQRLAAPGDLVNQGDAVLQFSSLDDLGHSGSIHDELLENLEGRRRALERRRKLLHEDYETNVALLRGVAASNGRNLVTLKVEAALSVNRRLAAEERFGRAQHLVESHALPRDDLVTLDEELQLRKLAVSERLRAVEAIELELETNQWHLERLKLDRDLGLTEIQGQLLGP